MDIMLYGKQEEHNSSEMRTQARYLEARPQNFGGTSLQMTRKEPWDVSLGTLAWESRLSQDQPFSKEDFYTTEGFLMLNLMFQH